MQLTSQTFDSSLDVIRPPLLLDPPRDYVDISIAVATPKGLVVPVLRNADQLSFAGVEKVDTGLGGERSAGAKMNVASLIHNPHMRLRVAPTPVSASVRDVRPPWLDPASEPGRLGQEGARRNDQHRRHGRGHLHD